MLRVGVVIDTFQQPAWARRVLEEIRSSNFAAISAVLILDRPRKKAPGDWYSSLAAARFRQDDDAFAAGDVRPLLPDAPVRDFAPSEEFDVILDFAHLRDDRGWWVSDDALSAFSTSAPMMTAELNAGSAGVIARAQIGTDRVSLHRGRSRLYWKVAKMVVRALDSMSRGDSFPRGTDKSVCATPTNFQIAKAGVRALFSEASQRFHDSWMREQWFIAFRFHAPDENPASELSRFQPIVPPRDRLWGDPFVVAEGGRTFVFLEEMLFRENRGTIAFLEVRRDGTWTEPQRVIERPYHMSYPCVFRWRGEMFMVPETSENRTIELYRCVAFPDRWELEAELMRGVSAVDSTIFELGGLWWMYTSTPSVGRTFDELSVYYAESPLGPWRPHRLNPVLTHVVAGRCGGAPFTYRGGVYRAAQNGVRRYGHALQMRQIVKLTPDTWEERECGDINPDWRAHLIGTHTLNHACGMTVIDGLQYRWAF